MEWEIHVRLTDGVNLMDKTCIVCGKSIGINKMFCSQKCRKEYLKNKRACIICGKLFWAAPSSGKLTCSIECEKKNRSIVSMENKYIVQGLKKAHEIAKTHPNTAPVETNASAKSWVLVSPDGEKYYVDNLALWARENSDIIPGTERQFCDSIRKIKYTMQGKRKRGNYQYKGWTLEEYFEENHARKNMEPIKIKKPRTKMSDEERLRRKRERAKEYYKRKKTGNK